MLRPALGIFYDSYTYMHAGARFRQAWHGSLKGFADTHTQHTHTLACGMDYVCLGDNAQLIPGTRPIRNIGS
eukprot:5884584-Pleurochrysis_carterae.AAC.2